MKYYVREICSKMSDCSYDSGIRYSYVCDTAKRLDSFIFIVSDINGNNIKAVDINKLLTLDLGSYSCKNIGSGKFKDVDGKSMFVPSYVYSFWAYSDSIDKIFSHISFLTELVYMLSPTNDWCLCKDNLHLEPRYNRIVVGTVPTSVADILTNPNFYHLFNMYEDNKISIPTKRGIAHYYIDDTVKILIAKTMILNGYDVASC